MNANQISTLGKATVTGAMPFPEIVNKLLDEGVEYYHVDYVALQIHFYGSEGGVVVVPLLLDGSNPVAQTLDITALKSAILDSQRNGQKFTDFCRRAVAAGVTSYFAFLRGQRVTYLGRTSEQHIEWFPGAKPTEA